MKSFILFLFIPFYISAQCPADYNLSQDTEVYRKIVKIFYNMLYKKEVTIREFATIYQGGALSDDVHIYVEDSLKNKSSNSTILDYQLERARINNTNEFNTPSYILKKMQRYFIELTAGLSLSNIDTIIKKAKVYNEGAEFSDILELSLSANNRLYFELNKDSPTQIIYIWLNDGSELYDKITAQMHSNMFFRVGIIDDKDGYVNVRDKPSKEAKIIDTLTSIEYFYYIPNGNSDWWQVAREDNQESVIGYIHKSRITEYAKIPCKLKKKIISDRKGC